MSDLENGLRSALARIPAPEGFTTRVMREIPQNGSAGGAWRQWLAAAAIVVLMIVVPLEYRERQSRADQAKRELLIALEVTAEKLEDVRWKLAGKEQP